jgi:hypothetical protein
MEAEFHASEKQNLEAYYKASEQYFLSSFAKGEQSSCLAYVDGHLAGMFHALLSAFSVCIRTSSWF